MGRQVLYRQHLVSLSVYIFENRDREKSRVFSSTDFRREQYKESRNGQPTKRIWNDARSGQQKIGKVRCRSRQRRARLDQSGAEYEWTGRRCRWSLEGSRRGERRARGVERRRHFVPPRQLHQTGIGEEDRLRQHGVQTDGKRRQLLGVLRGSRSEQNRCLPDRRSLRSRKHSTGRQRNLRARPKVP